MVKVHFVSHDGETSVVEAEPGTSVMAVAMGEGIDGIVAECGGSLMCATCHCYVDETWTNKIEARAENESDMLECAVSEVKPNSRLSCQIKLTDELDGLVVHLPEDQV